MLDVCFFSDRWHRHALATDASPAKEGYQSLQAAARDLLKDSYLPILCNALAAQDISAGLCLHRQLAALLALAHSAAEVIGWRDPRVQSCRSMRNYGLVNALWLGVLRCWSAVPEPLRPQMAQHGLGAADIAARLGVYLRSDGGMLCCRREAADVKLLQFWLMQAGKLAAAFPASAPTFFAEISQWEVGAREQLGRLGVEAADPKAVAVLQGAAAGSLWVRSARLQAHCLGAMDPETLLTATSALCGQLASSQDPGRRDAELAAALELTGHAGSLSPEARHATLQLLPAQLDALIGSAAAAASPDRRRQAVDSTLALALACAGAAGPGSQQLQRATWQDCQLYLFQASMRPHPLMSSAMTHVWSALVAACDDAAAKQLIVAMHELLAAVAATEAAADSYRPPSAIAGQLTGLLAAQLSAAPPGVAGAFFQRYIILSPVHADDRCQLACLGAVLRTTALVDSAAHQRGARWLERVLSVGLQLSRTLAESGGDRGCSKPWAGQDASAGHDAVHAAWLLDCLGACVEYVAAAVEPPRDEALPLVHAAAECAVRAVCARNMGHLAAAAAANLSPALATLCAACRANPGCLGAAQLEALLPLMDPPRLPPPLLAHAATLAAAYKSTVAPPGSAFASFLVAPDPVIRHLAVRSYVDYIRGCERCNMLRVLPRSLLDSGTGAMAAPFKAVVEQYLHALPATGFKGATDQELALWGGALMTACARLEAELQQACAAASAAAHRSPAVHGTCGVELVGGNSSGSGPDDAAAAAAVLEAAREVAGAVTHLEQKWVAGGAGPAGAETAAVLQQCQSRLAQLASARGAPPQQRVGAMFHGR